MTSKNYRAPLLHYIKLCASYQTPRWIRTAVAVRKRSIRGKIGNFLHCVTLKFDGWPWKTIRILFYVSLGFVHHFKAIRELKQKLQWKTIGHLFYVASSFVHYFIAIGEFKLQVTVQKHSIWVKIDHFLSRMTFKFDEWPRKTIGHLFHATSNSMHHFVAIGEFKLELQSGNAQFGSKSMIFRAVWPWNLIYDLELLHGITFVIGNNSWKFCGNTMTGT